MFLELYSWTWKTNGWCVNSGKFWRRIYALFMVVFGQEGNGSEVDPFMIMFVNYITNVMWFTIRKVCWGNCWNIYMCGEKEKSWDAWNEYVSDLI